MSLIGTTPTLSCLRRTMPSANCKSSDGISLRREATRSNFSRTLREAIIVAPPPVTALRLPHVPATIRHSSRVAFNDLHISQRYSEFTRRHLREGRFVALAVGMSTNQHGHLPIRIHAH